MILKVILDFVKVEIYVGDCEAFTEQGKITFEIGNLTNWGSKKLESYTKEEEKYIELLHSKKKIIQEKIYICKANASAFNVLEALTNKTMALLYVNFDGNISCQRAMLNIIESKKIRWYCNFSEFWFSPKTIKPDDLKKKIQHFKRLVREEIALIPF